MDEVRNNTARSEAKRLWLEERYRRWSAQLRVWRLCGRSKCRRTRRCSGDMRRCGLRLAECAKVFRLPPEREHDTADLDKRAFVADVMERIAENGKVENASRRLAWREAWHYVPQPRTTTMQRFIRLIAIEAASSPAASKRAHIVPGKLLLLTNP
jgi:hypothetical protein